MVNVPSMDIAEIFLKVWPEGVPAQEKAHWAAVPDARREAVLMRLHALALLDANEVQVGQAADRAGLSRQAFHKLRKRWLADRSIRSITPYRFKPSDAPGIDSKDAGQSFGRAGSSDRLAKRRATELIGDYPSESNGTLGRKLRDLLGDSISLPTAVKTIQRTRNATALNPSLLAKTYGSSLLIDLVGIRIDGVALDTDEPVMAALVLERATGLILGFDAGDPTRMERSQLSSIRSALDYIEHLGIDRAAEREARCRIVLPRRQSARGPAEPFRLALREALGKDNVFDRGTRRFGVRTTSIIGHKVNRVRLFSRIGEEGGDRNLRKALPESTEPMLTVEQFVTLARSEIDRRNQPLLEAVKKLVDQVTLSSSGVMAQTLTQVGAILDAAA